MTQRLQWVPGTATGPVPSTFSVVRVTVVWGHGYAFPGLGAVGNAWPSYRVLMYLNWLFWNTALTTSRFWFRISDVISTRTASTA